jgi:hypothetical protein
MIATVAISGRDPQDIQSLELTVGRIGPWSAVVDCVGEVQANEREPATIKHGDTTFAGTIVTAGAHAGYSRLRIVAGAAAWGATVAPTAYHSDGGVRASLVFTDLCRAVGERAGSFMPAADRLGADFARPAIKASAVLESIIGTVDWWVERDGRTHVGKRGTSDVQAQTLAFNPAERTVTLALDDLQTLTVGSSVSQGLQTPLTVQHYSVTIDQQGIRAVCGAREDVPSMLRGLIQREIARAVPAIQRYRVVQQHSDGRVDLQAESRRSGYPDLTSVEQWSAGGVYAALPRGSDVLVAWIGGDRSRPVVISHASRSAQFGADEVSLVAETVNLTALSPSQHAAVAELVDARIGTLVSALNTHVHPSLGAPGQAPPASPSPPPPGMVPPQASVASEKVRLS